MKQTSLFFVETLRQAVLYDLPILPLPLFSSSSLLSLFHDLLFFLLMDIYTNPTRSSILVYARYIWHRSIRHLIGIPGSPFEQQYKRIHQENPSVFLHTHSNHRQARY